MKRLYIMPLLAILSACASGSIFGNNPSDSVEPQQENVINQTNENKKFVPIMRLIISVGSKEQLHARYTRF